MQEKSLNIHCDKNGIRVQGARNIGSTSDTDASSKSDFLRICEDWWNTYVRGYKHDEDTNASNDTQGFWALLSDDGYIGLCTIMESPVTYDTPDPCLVVTFDTKEDAEAHLKAYQNIEAKPIFVETYNTNNERN